VCVSGVDFAWCLAVLGGHDCHQLDKSGLVTIKDPATLFFGYPPATTFRQFLVLCMLVSIWASRLFYVDYLETMSYTNTEAV
jgi:hypothetical protein